MAYSKGPCRLRPAGLTGGTDVYKRQLLDRVRPVAGQADLLAMQQEVSTVFVLSLIHI